MLRRLRFAYYDQYCAGHSDAVADKSTQHLDSSYEDNISTHCTSKIYSQDAQSLSKDKDCNEHDNESQILSLESFTTCNKTDSECSDASDRSSDKLDTDENDTSDDDNDGNFTEAGDVVRRSHGGIICTFRGSKGIRT